MKTASHIYFVGLVTSFPLVITGCLPSVGVPVPGETRTFDGIEFQWCPAGTFTMGSPSSETGHTMDEAQHEVTISKGFWLSKYEVTQAQWQDITGGNPSNFDDPGSENRPVDQVTWEGVQDFLEDLNAATSGGPYRLPTESEWEYACRAGTTTRFHWGDDPTESMIGDYAWYDGNSQDETHPVGGKMPNPWGLYDMNGNVWEWCQDWYGDYPAGPVTDPQGAASGTLRVLRGGGCDSYADDCRAANRFTFNPISSYRTIGFRIVRTPG